MTEGRPPIGLYIHVPFCLSKCPYCDFYSMKPEYGDFEEYANAVRRAAKYSGLNGRRVSTIYFGGGTPVLLPENETREIINTADAVFRIDEDAEITIEANPAAGPAKPGFNRVSFGIQSMVDEELAALGRVHTARQAKESVIAAHNSGAKSVSADVMLGIPGQTISSLKFTLDSLLALPLTHISAYMLKIEENTPFAEKGMQPAEEDVLADMYLFCVEYLKKHSFIQYEISNFAKDGAVSRHNLNYWRCGEYLGLGPSAHSFVDGKRFYFPRDINAFVRSENPFKLAVDDGSGGGFEECAMLRLRLAEGLDLNKAPGAEKIFAKARPMQAHGLLAIKNGVISLTPKGFLISNTIIAELLR